MAWIVQIVRAFIDWLSAAPNMWRDIVVVNRGGPGIATALQGTRLIADQGPRTHDRCELRCGLGECDDARCWRAHFEPASGYRDMNTSCNTSRSRAANCSPLTPVSISGRHRKWRASRAHGLLTSRHGSLGFGVGRHAGTAGSNPVWPCGHS
jgi:hypothetical protein